MVINRKPPGSTGWVQYCTLDQTRNGQVITEELFSIQELLYMSSPFIFVSLSLFFFLGQRLPVTKTQNRCPSIPYMNTFCRILGKKNTCPCIFQFHHTIAMAECSDVSAVKVFNYICGSGGVAELSHLLRHPSPLAKKTTAYEVILWFEIQKKSDPENGLVLIKNQHGKVIGIRIDLKKQLCLKYTTTESCRSGKRCKFWHLCKEFIEGTCKGTDCRRSHDFHDEDNKERTVELGFGSKPSGSLKGIVAGSFMQVCLMYLKNECIPDNCPYLHICPNVIRATPCECALSHNFADPHNRCILGQYGFRPPRTSEVDVVRCNSLVLAKNQKPFEASKMNLHSKVPKGEPGRQTGLLQDIGKTGVRAMTSLMSHHDTAIPNADPLPDRVFNFICGKGGVASLSDLLQHPSPLARKFAKPGQELDAKIWLQVEAQPEQGQRVSRIILLESQDGEIIGARVNSRKKICLNYSKGSCKSNNSCPFWHVCKSYLEGNCQGNCGLSHDLHDDGNVKKVKKLEIEKLPNGTLRSVVANSLPQVCQMYLKNNCQSSCCPYLHICSVAVQGHPCSCGLSHDLTDDHNTGILRQYDLAPEKTKFNIMQCNILIPQGKQQRIFEDKATSASSQVSLNMMGSPVPLMSLPTFQQHENVLGPQSQGSSNSTEKKKRRRPRSRKKKTNQKNEAAGESQHTNADDMEEKSSDSVSDNEDVQDKPDLYSSSKFAVDTNKPSPISWQKDFMENEIDATTSMKPGKKQRAQSNKGLIAFQNEPVSEMNVAAEVNLIDLSDDEALDDWEGVDASIDDLWTEPPLLSQVDEFFFNSSFSSNVAGSLSQSSTFSNPADQISPESNSDKSAIHVQSIFQYICNEHNGQVPYALISQHPDLFPSEVIDIAAWFRENDNRFITIENSTGEIEAIRTHSTKARICFRYLMAKQGCKDPKCFRYHVCKHYLANGICPLGKKCRFSHSHSLKSAHNTRITKQLRFKSFSEEQLRVLVSASVPEVCLDYNRPSKGCKRGLRCIGIHICKYFVMGNCKKGDDCPFSHQNSLETPHSKLVLGRYNLTKVPPRAVLNALLIRQRQPSEKMREQPKTG